MRTMESVQHTGKTHHKTLIQRYTIWVIALALFFTFGLRANLNSSAYFLGMAVAALSVLYAYKPRLSTFGLVIACIIYCFRPNDISFAIIGCFVPLVMAVSARRMRTATVYSAIVVVGAGIQWILFEDSNPAFTVTVFVVASWLLGIVLQGYNDRVKVEEAKAAQAAAAAKLEAAEFAKEIAREMHDAVAHSMSSVVLRARMAKTREGLTQSTQDDLESITDLSIQALGEMRALLKLLRGSDENEARYRNYMIIDLREECARNAQFLESQDFQVKQVIEGDFEAIDPLAVSTFVACIREASANVIRHGDDSKPVILTVNADQDYISLAVINTIDHEKHKIFPSSGLGLVGIRERVEAVGGSVNSTEAGGRWLLNFSIPKRISAQDQGELQDVD